MPVLNDRVALFQFTQKNPDVFAVVSFSSDLEPGLPIDDATENSVISISLRRRQEGVAVHDAQEAASLHEAYYYGDQTEETATPEVRRLRRFVTANSIAFNLRGLLQERSVYLAAQSVMGLRIMSDDAVNLEVARVDQLRNSSRRIHVERMSTRR